MNKNQIYLCFIVIMLPWMAAKLDMSPCIGRDLNKSNLLSRSTDMENFYQ